MGWTVGEKYYRAEAVVIREVNGIKIVFYNHETIYVQEADGKWTIFHRWFTPRGSYNADWRPFRHKLFTQKKIDMAHCYRLAFQHNIVSQRANNPPDLSKVKVQARFT